MEIAGVIERSLGSTTRKLAATMDEFPYVGDDVGKLITLSMNITEVSASWTFTASMVKDIGDALKSIVNR
ncbi:hypothetical protein [Limnobacter sp.]|jgi:hypothetical protein|uniref:hypothetical protein n=1 Tax=Limnobacter sp. TaxID=2003368 RepID=UPI00311E4E6B